MSKSAQAVVYFVSNSEPKYEIVTRATPYKFSLLNQSIIRSLWEIGHNIVLKNPNKVRPMELEIIFRGIIKDQR